MRNKILVALLSFFFVLGLSVDAEAQSRKKKKGKQRPAKTEESDSGSQRSSSQRSTRASEDQSFWTKDKLVYDLLGDFRISGAGPNITILKFGLKPAVSYKVLPRLSFGIAPKIEYYFWNIVDQEDINEFDLGVETFGRFQVLESIYLQAGYDFNNGIFAFTERTWLNSAVVGGGYMTGFGKWRYGAQALLNLNEERRDQYGVIEVWFGLTYNL